MFVAQELCCLNFFCQGHAFVILLTRVPILMGFTVLKDSGSLGAVDSWCVPISTLITVP